MESWQWLGLYWEFETGAVTAARAGPEKQITN